MFFTERSISAVGENFQSCMSENCVFAAAAGLTEAGAHLQGEL